MLETALAVLFVFAFLAVTVFVVMNGSAPTAAHYDFPHLFESSGKTDAFDVLVYIGMTLLGLIISYGIVMAYKAIP